MHILTFDVEEWFHILDNYSTKTEDKWSKYEVRIHKNMDRIFTLLQENNVKATFFCLGWIARKYPEVIKKIDALGYDIGSHSDMHQLAYEQNRKEYKADLETSIKSIEDITGKKVISYRAPGFSVTEQNIWVFEELVKHGIEIDCSIFPAKRAHGGFPSFGISEPCLIKTKGLQIKEFPLNLFNVLSKEVVLSGGGYFRFFPYKLIKNRFDEAKYVMTYFHPRDFDPDQPIISSLGAFRKFRSYFGLSHCYAKLDAILKHNSFICLQSANEAIDWENVSVKFCE